MPDPTRDTAPIEPVAPMPPGFDELPAEERLFIFGNKDKPEMMAVYQSTKLVQLHDKVGKHDSRIESLEDSRKKAKWVGGTLLLIFTAVKGFILSKIFGVFS